MLFQRLGAFAFRFQTPATLIGVWLLFGAAFPAVRLAVHGPHAEPPLLFSGARFLAAGTILLTWSAWRAHWRLSLRRSDVAAAAVVGLGLVACGQGTAGWGAQYVPAGIVAVLVTTVPVWVVVFSSFVMRDRPPLTVVAGVLIGFAGVAFLASPSGGANVPFLPAVLILGGSIAQAGAVLYGSRTAISRRPMIATSIQLLAGGACQLLVGLSMGEPGRVNVAALMGSAGLAWLYLVLGVSVIGYPLFTRLIATTPPPVANTQSYVAPVVALFLGWLLLNEPVGLRTLVAAAVTLVSVAAIVTASGRRAARRAQAAQARTGLSQDSLRR